MANGSPLRSWWMRLVFVAVALLIIFFHLLPLQTQPRSWAPPDLLIAFAMAWSLRRPDYVPALLIAIVMLLADMMFQRPPGLKAMLVVLGCEFLKSRAQPRRDNTFAGEWLSVALVLAAIFTLNRLILALLAVPHAPFGLSLLQVAMTMITYPLVVFVSQSVLGVRKLSPSEAEALGAR